MAFAKEPRLKIRNCQFCSGAMKESAVDFKDATMLRTFTTEKGKILPRRISGNCARHQRIVARAIKRARHAAVVAFQAE